MSEECTFHLKTVSKMEPLEYRSVIKFLNMQGKSPSGVFEEMPVLLNCQILGEKVQIRLSFHPR